MRDFIVFVCGGIIGIFCMYYCTIPCKECPKQIKEEIIKDTLPELTKENVLKEIIKNDIKYPLIVYRQVLWETGHLKCKNCSLDVNNLLGFAWTGKSYRKYNHWIESIKDYKVFQLKYYKEGDYYQFLEDIGYAESKNYVVSLQSIKL